MIPRIVCKFCPVFPAGVGSRNPLWTASGLIVDRHAVLFGGICAVASMIKGEERSPGQYCRGIGSGGMMR